MNVIEVLTREHKLFETLARRLDVAALASGEGARRELRMVLLVLLPALDRHEHIEDEVFGQPGYASKGQAQKILHEVALEHAHIAGLRGRLMGALHDTWQDPDGRLQTEARDFAAHLRSHMRTEEIKLWPLYAQVASRSLDASTARRAQAQVEQLEHDVKTLTGEVEDYLGGKR